jgi:hypothetical protein
MGRAQGVVPFQSSTCFKRVQQLAPSLKKSEWKGRNALRPYYFFT